MITKDWILEVEARRQELKAHRDSPDYADIWSYEQYLVYLLIEAENKLEAAQEKIGTLALLQAKKQAWWEADKQATIRAEWVEKTQEGIESDILDLVLGVRK